MPAFFFFSLISKAYSEQNCTVAHHGVCTSAAGLWGHFLQHVPIQIVPGEKLAALLLGCVLRQRTAQQQHLLAGWSITLFAIWAGNWGELPVEVVVLAIERKWSAAAAGVTLVVLVSSGA